MGTETTINSGDMAGILMIAVQAPEKRTVDLARQPEEQQAQNAALKERLARLEGL